MPTGTFRTRGNENERNSSYDEWRPTLQTLVDFLGASLSLLQVKAGAIRLAALQCVYSEPRVATFFR